MQKAAFAIGTSVIAGVLVWWLTNVFEGPDPIIDPPPPPPEPEPRVTCVGTVVAGEELECVFDIDGPDLFAVTLTPSSSARSWSVGLRCYEGHLP